MRALAVVLALALWPALAGAELRTRSRDLGAASPVVDYAQWPAPTTMTGSTCDVRASDLLTGRGAAITFARSDSTLCCPESDAVCCWAAANQPCIHAPSYSGWASGGTVAGGVEVFGAGANNVAWSNDLSHWNVRGSATVAADTAPDGTNTASKITVTNNGNDVYLDTAGFTSGGAVATSLFVKRTSTSGALTIQSSRGAAYGQWTVNLATLGADYTRIWSAHPAVTVVSPFVAAGTASGVQIFGDGTARTVTVYCVSQQDGAVVKPPRATTGTAYAGNASTATTLGGTAALLNKDRWALGVSATPTGGWATVSTGLLQWGGAYGAANSVSVYTDASAKLVVEIYDGASGWRRWTADAALSGTGQKKIGVAYSSGTIRVLIDGAEVTGTMSGAGTGLLAALPSTSLVVGTTGSSILRGLDARVCQASDLAGLKRCLQ